MATTSAYKQYTRGSRVMTVEELFNKGIFYTDVPLDEGFVKTLVNYNVIHDGSTLTPRGGLYNSDVMRDALNGNPTTSWGNLLQTVIHHTGMTLVKDATSDDATLCRYALVGTVVQTPTLGTVLDLANTVLILEWDNVLRIATNMNIDVAAVMGSSVSGAHSVDIVTTCPRDGVHTSLDGCTHLPIVRKVGANFVRSLGVLIPTITASALSWKVEDIVPKAIQPSQAINYGYNMLKEDPYTFPNTVTTTGGLILNGVIPKDKAGEVVFTSRVGEEINFHLNYQYPNADIEKKYYVQWEMNDLETNGKSTVLKSLLESPVAYTPGESIVLTVAPSYKAFTLIAKVYYKDVIDAYKTATPAATQADIDNLAPIKAMVLASYYLTADNNSSTYNVTPKKFDLTTAQGMCTWQQRLVLWGVKGARTTLFVSEPNAPAYIPYPNNAEILNENIVAAIPYMGKLLVFTYNSLYMLTMGLDGISYTTKCIQDNLVMTDDDAHTLRAVRNMIYFRSGNYFYMVVPNNYAGVGELQLAPISTPIAPLLDSFKENIYEIVDDVYNLVDNFKLLKANNDDYTLHLADYCNYLDGDKMRNIYKWRVDITKSNVVTKLYLDFVLTYDTVLRVWAMHIYQTNEHRIVPYEYNVADSTTLLSIINNGAKVNGVGLIKTAVLTAEDTFAMDFTAGLNERAFPNYQMINTGYRKHAPQYKKRFREIQFTVNNTSHALLEFHSSILVDDDTRKNMYTYNTIHNTDKNDPNYGLIFIERAMEEPETVYGEIMFTDDKNAWKLDFSKFPDLTIAKVSLKLTGKGYNGKLKLLSKNKEMYELLTTNWVYRVMYGR